MKDHSIPQEKLRKPQMGKCYNRPRDQRYLFVKSQNSRDLSQCLLLQWGNGCPLSLNVLTKNTELSDQVQDQKFHVFVFVTWNVIPLLHSSTRIYNNSGIDSSVFDLVFKAIQNLAHLYYINFKIIQSYQPHYSIYEATLYPST